ncbi:MAG TPA: hypothetical protein VK699_14775 [Terriglobales bacterium]|jgi:hypothetical protein|nr:hypothetical protein [Terriglobales bacterium]
MFKIYVIEGRIHRTLVLEGKLVAPWIAELRTACENARADLHDRELVIEIKNLTAISQAGENLLLELMRQGVAFRPDGVFTKHVLAQLARRAYTDFLETRR